MNVTGTEAAHGSGSPYEIAPEFDVDPQSPQEPEARTLELNLADAERFMPEPTMKAPWFGYDSYADAGYGEDGLDAVAENDGGTKSGSRLDDEDDADKSGDTNVYIGSCICKDCSKQEDTDTNVVVKDSTLKTDNDTVDVKSNTVNTDVNTDRANGRADGGSQGRSSGGESAGGSGSKSGDGRSGAKK